MTSYEAASADIESIDEMIAKHPADARFIRLAPKLADAPFCGANSSSAIFTIGGSSRPCLDRCQLAGGAEGRRPRHLKCTTKFLTSTFSVPPQLHRGSISAMKLTTRNFGRGFLNYL